MEIGLLGELGSRRLLYCSISALSAESTSATDCSEGFVTGRFKISVISVASLRKASFPGHTSHASYGDGIKRSVYTTVDFADAAVRGIHGGMQEVFLQRITYVGIAPFVVACVADAIATHEERNPEAGEKPEETYLGGGAIASGGSGMVGGTALIAGGGVLPGTVGGRQE